MDAAERYHRDPQFKALVQMMVAHALSLDMSPGEMREAAIFAEVKVQAMKPVGMLFPNRAREIDFEMRREEERRKRG